MKLLALECTPRHNLSIAYLLRHLWNLVRQHYSVCRPEWRKSHQRDVGNEFADVLAKAGADPDDRRTARLTGRSGLRLDWDPQPWLASLAHLECPELERTSWARLPGFATQQFKAQFPDGKATMPMRMRMHI